MVPNLGIIVDDWIVPEQRRVSEPFRTERTSEAAIAEAETFCCELLIVSEFALQQGQPDVSERCLDLVEFWRLTILRLSEFQRVWLPHPTNLLPSKILADWLNSIPSASLSNQIFMGVGAVDPVLLFSAVTLGDATQSRWGASRLPMKELIDNATPSILSEAERVDRNMRPTMEIRDGDEIYWRFELPGQILGEHAIIFEVREDLLSIKAVRVVTDLWLNRWELLHAA